MATSFPLPDGAVLSPPQCHAYAQGEGLAKSAGIGGCTVVERVLRWTPTREQWGLRTQSCMRAQTQSSISAGLCLAVLVHKCTYCVQPGDSLQGIAANLDADWLQLWGANVHLSNPFQLQPRQLVLLGPLLQFHTTDSLASLAARFGTAPAAIRTLNPLDFDLLEPRGGADVAEVSPTVTESHMCVCVCVCVCMYLYVYIHINIYIDRDRYTDVPRASSEEMSLCESPHFTPTCLHMDMRTTESAVLAGVARYCVR